MRYVALLRGINVGGNTRVPMAVLREIFADMGATDVMTVLNSGNVVFTAAAEPSASALENRIFEATGVRTRVLIVDAGLLRSILEAMPFEGDESQLVVMFMSSVPTVEIPGGLEPEEIVLGEHAVYQSHPNGISHSKLKPSFWKQFPADATGRNLRTVKKLVELL